MTFKICYWDEVAGMQKERDSTPAEDAQRDAEITAANVRTVPLSIPKLNARLVLLQAGYWEEVVQFATEKGPIALAFLEDAQTMRRDNALVNEWAALRGKSDELDALFIAGAALDVDAYA